MVVKEVGQVAQPASPVLLERVQPGIDLRERARRQVVDPLLAAPFLRDEVGILQHAEVLGHRGAAELEQSDDLADRTRTLPQRVEDPPAHRVAQCGVRIHRHTTSISRKSPTYRLFPTYSPVTRRCE